MLQLYHKVVDVTWRTIVVPCFFFYGRLSLIISNCWYKLEF